MGQARGEGRARVRRRVKNLDAEFEAARSPTTRMHYALLTANIGMWKHDLFRFGRKRWHKPAEKDSRGESTKELRYYKARHIGGRIPAKVSVNARASVTAGLAKEVEAVNQYAPVM